MEVFQGFPSDLDYLADVDGILSALPGPESDLPEGHLLFIVCKICCHHDIRQVVILVESRKILGNGLRFHESERCIRVRNLDVEIALEKETDNLFDESPGLAVASYDTVSEDSLVSVAELPESVKLFRKRLSVRVCLEDIISTILDGI